MAGPELTAETFARGQFRVPPAGGGPTTPQVSYGNWGFFEDTDYAGIDDSAEIWWDPTRRGRGRARHSGAGAWRRSNGAARFTIDEAPEPAPFTDASDALTIVDRAAPGGRSPGVPAPTRFPGRGRPRDGFDGRDAGDMLSRPAPIV